MSSGPFNFGVNLGCVAPKIGTLVFGNIVGKSVQPSRSRSNFTSIGLGIGTDLTAMAGAWQFNPLVGRRAELRTLTLNVVSGICTAITGEPGVGKSALVEGLAYAITIQDREIVPPSLDRHIVLQLTPVEILSGTKSQAELEARLASILRYLGTDPVIAVFDELSVLAQNGDYGSLWTTIVSSLARGMIGPAVACMEDDDYATIIRHNEVLNSRFARLQLREPDEAECLDILRESLPIGALPPHFRNRH